MFTQEQEVKRSKEWKVVMAISSIFDYCNCSIFPVPDVSLEPIRRNLGE